MIFKDIKEMDNLDFPVYAQELEDEYESTKAKIENLCKYLEVLDREYEKLMIEKNNRNLF